MRINLREAVYAPRAAWPILNLDVVSVSSIGRRLHHQSAIEYLDIPKRDEWTRAAFTRTAETEDFLQVEPPAPMLHQVDSGGRQREFPEHDASSEEIRQTVAQLQTRDVGQDGSVVSANDDVPDVQPTYEGPADFSDLERALESAVGRGEHSLHNDVPPGLGLQARRCHATCSTQQPAASDGDSCPQTGRPQNACPTEKWIRKRPKKPLSGT